MNKFFLLVSFYCISYCVFAQIKIDKAIVPKYMQGKAGTNNNRLPFAYWVELSGLTPGVAYKYYNLIDTAGGTDKGAGGVYFVNKTSGDIRRSTNTSFTNPASYDSIEADLNGKYSGWFMNEGNGNEIFATGNIVFPKISLKTGSTAVEKIFFTNYPVHVIDFGKNAGAGDEGSVLWDSSNVLPKSFVFLYDSISGTGKRPVAGTIIEDDKITAPSSMETFYKTYADERAGCWGTIIPNNLPDGIRLIEYRNFDTGNILHTSVDRDGIWCGGANTVNAHNGTTASLLNSSREIKGTIITSKDTVEANEFVNFSALSNVALTSYLWNFGDLSASTFPAPDHAYLNSGEYVVSLTVSDGICESLFYDTVVVELITSSREYSSDNQVQVHPNPGNGFFTVNTTISGNKEVQVYDVIGEKHFSLITYQNSFRLDLTHLNKGIYFVRIKDQAGRIVIRRIVIN